MLAFLKSGCIYNLLTLKKIEYGQCSEFVLHYMISKTDNLIKTSLVYLLIQYLLLIETVNGKIHLLTNNKLCTAVVLRNYTYTSTYFVI